jgi:hypothetical protein
MITITHQASGHVGAHTPESNHSDLHLEAPLLSIDLCLKITET